VVTLKARRKPGLLFYPIMPDHLERGHHWASDFTSNISRLSEIPIYNYPASP